VREYINKYLVGYKKHKIRKEKIMELLSLLLCLASSGIETMKWGSAMVVWWFCNWFP
jgi:hypothetical protein